MLFASISFFRWQPHKIDLKIDLKNIFDLKNRLKMSGPKSVAENVKVTGLLCFI